MTKTISKQCANHATVARELALVWFKVDDGFAFHPKAMAAGNAALGLWVRAGSWCGKNLTDGVLPANMIGTLGGQKRDVQKLIAAGLWSEICGALPHMPNTSGTQTSHVPNTSGTQTSHASTTTNTTSCGDIGTVVGYQFLDWPEWQPTKEQVKHERDATRHRVAKWREDQRNGVTNTVSNGVSTDAHTRPDPTRPVLPTEVPNSKTSPKRNRAAVAAAHPAPGTEQPARFDVERICGTLAQRIADNGSKRPIVTMEWRREARLMIDRDGRTLEQIIQIIDFSQNSSFWKANILSMTKLRTKFDQLRLQCDQDAIKLQLKPNNYRGPNIIQGAPGQMRIEQ